MKSLTSGTTWLQRLLAKWTVTRKYTRKRVQYRRRTAACAILVGVVIFIALQLGLGVAAELSYTVRDPGYSDKELRLARQEAANAGGPVVVMIGTSRTGFGFNAGRLQTHFTEDVGHPATVFNFGIPASGPVTHYMYTKRLLEQGHRPALLLIEVLPPSLAQLDGGPLESRFVFGDRLCRSEVEQVARYDFPAEDVRRQWRSSVFTPWYGLRFPLLGRVSPSALPWHLRFDWSRTTDPHGWSTPIVEELTPEQYLAGFERAAGEYRAILADMYPTGGAARALTDLLRLCQQKGIPTRLVMMPESSEFRRLYTPVTTARLYQFLNQQCEEHGTALVDARDWVPNTGFTDGHHMVRSGAVTFSDRLYHDVIRPVFRP